MLECVNKSGWIQFLEFIEGRCSSAEFQNWIAPIQLVEISTEEVILEVPNVFVKEYLLDNFKDVLADFLPLRNNGEPAIQFQITAIARPTIIPPEQEVKEETSELKINPLYTFENFIEGPSNQ